MKKQTAIEWLEDKINDELEIYNNQWLLIENFIEQAKIIEKQQIINTWYDCKLSIIEKNPIDANQYFDETFKK